MSSRRYAWSDRHDGRAPPRIIESARSLVYAGGAAAGAIVLGVTLWSALRRDASDIVQAAQIGVVDVPVGFKNGIVRASPAFDAPEVAQLPKGTQVDLVDLSPDTRWFQVRCAALGERTAWIHRDVVRIL